MADYKDRLEGAPSAVATYVQILSGTSPVIAATHLDRRTVTVIPDKDIGINYGAAATAVAGQAFQLGASSVLNETYYTGPIFAACASGASGGAYVLDVYGN